MDLRQITSAPWEFEQQDQRDAETVYCQVKAPDGKNLFDTCNSEAVLIEDDSDEDGPHFRDAVGAANLRFCALARNAQDVMTRRGWGCAKLSQGWVAVALKGDDICPRMPIVAEDGFTALVEADKWYAAYVEKKGRQV